MTKPNTRLRKKRAFHLLADKAVLSRTGDAKQTQLLADPLDASTTLLSHCEHLPESEHLRKLSEKPGGDAIHLSDNRFPSS